MTPVTILVNLYERSTKTVSQTLLLHYIHICNPLLLLCPSELLALAASAARSQHSHLWVSQFVVPLVWRGNTPLMSDN